MRLMFLVASKTQSEGLGSNPGGATICLKQVPAAFSDASRLGQEWNWGQFYDRFTQQHLWQLELYCPLPVQRKQADNR